ncbi:hypothetical protein BH18ACT12_BH18ACT12_09990 [soil metagenome]
MARAPLYAVIALLALLVPQSAGAVALGDERVLIVLATSGPRPYGVADVERTVRDSDAFFRRSSLGQVRLHSDVTPWLAAFSVNPGCGGLTKESFEAVIGPARLAASRAGFNSSGYDRTMYAIADSRCAFHGETWGQEVMLTRQPTRQLMLHELGHTLGLGHARATNCATGPVRSGCDVEETGDPLSPMGSGTMDFSAYEKVTLGWLPRQPHVTAAARYTLATPTYKTKLPQALVVETEQGAWWIEYRSLVRGLVIRLVDEPFGRSPFATSSVLIANPTRAGRLWVSRGESYRIPGSLRVTLERAGTAQARVRFR